MTMTHLRRAAFLGGIALLFGLSSVRADTVNDLVPRDLPITMAGSYLAGRSADAAEDMSAAAKFFSEVLKSDPHNASLIERVLILRLANGDLPDAIARAKELVKIDVHNPLGRLTLGIDEIHKGAYEASLKQFTETASAPLARLTAGLLGAWAEQALGHTDKALARIDALEGPSWYGIFKQYHHALIADLAGRSQDAAAAITQAFHTDGAALRVVEAYAEIMARAGKRSEGIAALETYIAQAASNATTETLLKNLKAEGPAGPVVGSPVKGAAEVLYGLGSAIGTDQGSELPAAYMRLALYVDPASNLTRLALGDLFQSVRLYEPAIAAYDAVPADSKLRRDAEVQIGACLDHLDRPDEAAAHIKRVVDKDPADLAAVIALGNVYRSHDRFEEAAATYSKGIATIAKPGKADWRIFYYRGVSLERSKRWPEAEADFKLALKLNPDQPQVLNYLGYSWVDQGVHLDKALQMIKTAVDLRPNDGYIVDSLGWAYYRLGRYDDAVSELERAIELKPEDSVINDHLGDAYWRVGRKRDALFQWMHSRDLGPEKDQLPRILAKIEHGLDGSKAAPEHTPDGPQKSENDPATRGVKAAAADEGQ